VQADGNITDGVEDDPVWDTLWKTRGPGSPRDGLCGPGTQSHFKSIRFPSDREQVWGLVLGRFIKAQQRVLRMAAHEQPAGLATLQQGGDLEGLRDISPAATIQIIPYGRFAQARYLDTPATTRLCSRRTGRPKPVWTAR